MFTKIYLILKKYLGGEVMKRFDDWDFWYKDFTKLFPNAPLFTKLWMPTKVVSSSILYDIKSLFPKKPVPMTPEHELWSWFVELLESSEFGINLEYENDKKTGQVLYETMTWDCDHTRSKAESILNGLDDIDVKASLAYFDEHSGYCDCEILFNVRGGEK